MSAAKIVSREWMVGEGRQLVYLSHMKSLTVEEATPGLGRLVELALAGEQIQIREGNGVVVLRPTQKAQAVTNVEPLPDEVLERTYSKLDEEDEAGARQFMAAQAVGGEE